MTYLHPLITPAQAIERIQDLEHHLAALRQILAHHGAVTLCAARLLNAIEQSGGYTVLDPTHQAPIRQAMHALAEAIVTALEQPGLESTPPAQVAMSIDIQNALSTTLMDQGMPPTGQGHQPPGCKPGGLDAPGCSAAAERQSMAADDPGRSGAAERRLNAGVKR